VEIPAATAKGIIVMNTPFGNSITTAEHAITLMLALAREIPQADVEALTLWLDWAYAEAKAALPKAA